MSKSRLGFQLQRPHYPGWIVNHILGSKCRWVKIINPDKGPVPPMGNTVQYIGRLYFDGEPDKELVWKGTSGAHELWNLVWERMKAAPWVNVWETPNEPAIDSPDKARSWAAFSRRYVGILHSAGLKVATGCFSTGTPELHYWGMLWPGIEFADYLAVHEYGMRHMTLDGWHLLRYRKALTELTKLGYHVPPVMITETGIDYAGDPQHDGWQAQPGMTEEIYMAQLTAYDHELQRDSEVICATPFVWLHQNWPSFDIYESMSGRISDYMRQSDDVERIIGEAVQDWIIPLNPDAAFQKAGHELGYLAQTTEQRIDIQGTRYAYQAFRHPGEPEWQRIVYAIEGDWGHLHWFRRAN